MAQDFYKRKLPGKAAVAPAPVVSTKGASFGGELKEIPSFSLLLSMMIRVAVVLAVACPDSSSEPSRGIVEKYA